MAASGYANISKELGLLTKLFTHSKLVRKTKDKKRSKRMIKKRISTRNSAWKERRTNLYYKIKAKMRFKVISNSSQAMVTFWP